MLNSANAMGQMNRVELIRPKKQSVEGNAFSPSWSTTLYQVQKKARRTASPQEKKFVLIIGASDPGIARDVVQEEKRGPAYKRLFLLTPPFAPSQFVPPWAIYWQAVQKLLMLCGQKRPGKLLSLLSLSLSRST